MAENNPVVSVWMTTYNHEKFIAQAIESVIAQKTTFKIELLIGEDCSTDNTGTICKSYAAQYPEIIRLFSRPVNIGMIENGLQTLKEARGKYIAILEGDDYWTDYSKLEQQVSYLEANPDCSICFHNIKVIHENKNKKPYLLSPIGQPRKTSINDLAIKNYVPTLACVFRNGNIQEFPAWFKKIGAGDYCIHMLNGKHGNIGYINKVMGVYRVHGGGVWSEKSLGENFIKWFEMLSYLKTEFQSPVKDRLILQQLNYFLAIIRMKDKTLVDELFSNHQEQVIELLKEVHPINVKTLIKSRFIPYKLKSLLLFPIHALRNLLNIG